MNLYFTNALLQAAPNAQPAAAPNQFMAMLPIIFMFFIVYFLLIRPQKKRQMELQKTIEALKKGDKIVTNGGIIGTVVGVKDKTVVVRVGDGETKIEFLKSAVSHQIKDGEQIEAS